MQENGAAQSVARTFAMLEALAQYPDGAPIKQLAQQMGLPKSTAHRLLASLVGLGYAAQAPGTGYYRATLKLFEVGSAVVGRIDVVSTARPHLNALSAAVGETVHLVVQDNTDVVYVFKTEGEGMRMSSRLGSRMPLYSTGVGKAILSALPYGEAKRLWDASDIRPITPNTICRFEDMEAELAATKRRGWAMDNEENELGIRCVAMALPAAGGPPSAFSISGLAAAMDDARVQALAGECRRVRQNILAELGLSGG